MTVMVGDFSQKRSYLRKIRSVICLLKRDVGKIYQLKVAKFKEKTRYFDF